MTTTPAGWYADANDPTLLRYWDGTRWTEHVAPAQAPAQRHAQTGYGTAPSPAGPPPFAPGAGQPPPNRSPWRSAVTFLAAHPTKRTGANWAIWAAAVLVVLGATASATSSPKTTPAADHPTRTQTGSTAAPPAVSTRPAASPGSSTAAKAPRRTSTPPRPAATTGGVRVPAPGVVLPDPARTPGATNPTVTQATIASTICVSGWTATIRPPSSYTTELKEQQLASGYAYHGDLIPGDYEEDHLISLELGGSPTSVRNLWPEPYAAAEGARVKDQIENKLHSLVCSGTITLATAQHAIATNWWAAYDTYGAAPAPQTTTHTTTHAPAPAPAPTTAVGPPPGATALCNDGTYSYAAHHQGACSHHGGVAVFYK
jgi:hypothetical protein